MPAWPVVLVAVTCWLPPVGAPVADPFRPPSCRWCPGNRGIEYATAPGEPVRAVATGVVTFAGTVAGTSYVVVRLGDGRRVTYGGLDAVAHASGDLVVAGSIVGRTAGRLHFGLREAPVPGDDETGERYVDPAPMLGTLVGRPRLVPTDGTPARPAPSPRLRCPAQSPLSP
jgi:murein DD-endopeptidase MepM/ murein hydrolase activator NlpD